MIKLFYTLIFILGSTWSAVSATQNEEEWSHKKLTKISQKFRAAAQADQNDSLSFERRHSSPQEALEFLLVQYPPKKGGLYSSYKSEVDSLIKRYIGYFSPQVEWLPPWSLIASDTLGANNPYDVIPGLIALTEIRRVSGFKELSKDIFRTLREQGF